MHAASLAFIPPDHLLTRNTLTTKNFIHFKIGMTITLGLLPAKGERERTVGLLLGGLEAHLP